MGKGDLCPLVNNPAIRKLTKKERASIGMPSNVYFDGKTLYLGRLMGSGMFKGVCIGITSQQLDALEGRTRCSK